MELDYIIDEIIEDLCGAAKSIGWYIDGWQVHFNCDRRDWCLYVDGYALGLPVKRFGAYRDYLGGDVLGSIRSNGREQEDTLELAGLFEDALKKIEAAINSDYEDAAAWELPTGVLL